MNFFTTLGLVLLGAADKCLRLRVCKPDGTYATSDVPLYQFLDADHQPMAVYLPDGSDVRAYASVEDMPQQGKEGGR